MPAPSAKDADPKESLPGFRGSRTPAGGDRRPGFPVKRCGKGHGRGRRIASRPMDLDAIVTRALEEDVGPGDVTTRATVPAAARARARITQKQPGVLFGLAVAEAVFRTLDPGVRIARLASEGHWREDGPVLELDGAAGALLTAERTALNFLQRLSGVATMTARYVEAVAGTGVRVLDTRKTTPGLRML